jgi:hypothetical protein
VLLLLLLLLPQALFDAAATTAIQLMPGFKPQGMVNVLWAYTTTLKHVPPDLLTAASDECLARGSNLAGFGPLNLARLAWVHSKCRTINPMLAAALSRAALQTLHTFSAADLSKLLASMVQLGWADVQLLDAAESRLLSFLERLQHHGEQDVQVLCQGVWAFAASNHPSATRLTELLLDLAGRLVWKLARSGDATARLLGTLVLLRYRADGFMQLLADRLLLGAAVTGSTAAAAAPAAAAARGAAPAAAAASGAPPPMNHLLWWDTNHLVQAAACLARSGYTQHTALLQLLLSEFETRLPTVASLSSNKQQQQQQQEQQHNQQQHRQQQQLLRPFASHAALLLWCCAVLDVQQQQLLGGAVRRLVKFLRQAEVAGCQLPQKSLAQLVQVQMWLQVRACFDCPYCLLKVWHW